VTVVAVPSSARESARRKAALEKAAAGTGVEVSQTGDNRLKLALPGDLSFDSGSAEIRPGMRPILDELARDLRAQPAAVVHIVGHTDSARGDAFNDPLSVNRASHTRDYLVARGVDSRRITIDGRGARDPVADNATEAGRPWRRQG
jgi:outer membrane protein OmpA-like peptidoglycan-associated protein